jgi:GT2 family glycosyltransferase
MTQPEVSVVVPVRDGASTIPPLLASLAEQSGDPERLELIVVDNASRDGTAEIARRGGARVVEEPRPNRALARNRGVAIARGRSLLFVDGDCIVGRGWAEALTDCLERSELAAGAVRTTTSEHPNRYERFDLFWRFPQERYVSQGFAASANLAIRRECFEAIGGFETGYRHIGEDVDLCLRARAAGFGLTWCPDAVVSHSAETALGPVLRRGFRQGFAQRQLLSRVGSGVGARLWAHPGQLVRGDWPLRRLGGDPGLLERGERDRLMWVARAEGASRMAGSLWAELIDR